MYRWIKNKNNKNVCYLKIKLPFDKYDIFAVISKEKENLYFAYIDFDGLYGIKENGKLKTLKSAKMWVIKTIIRKMISLESQIEVICDKLTNQFFETQESIK